MYTSLSKILNNTSKFYKLVISNIEFIINDINHDAIIGDKFLNPEI